MGEPRLVDVSSSGFPLSPTSDRMDTPYRRPGLSLYDRSRAKVNREEGVKRVQAGCVVEREKNKHLWNVGHGLTELSLILVSRAGITKLAPSENFFS